jgi:hypothetical protein
MKTKQQPSEINLNLTIDKVRMMGRTAMKEGGEPTTNVNEFSSERAEAFLLLHGPALLDRLNKTIRSFIAEKLVGASA